MGIKFDKDPLALEQNNYTTKIVNVYIACVLGELTETLVRHRESLVLILVKQNQNFAWICIIMLIIVIC